MKTKLNSNNRFNETIINVIKDARIGINLNHSWAVDIESVSGNQGSLFLILICNQKIDSGYTNFANVPRNGDKINLSEYKKIPDIK